MKKTFRILVLLLIGAAAPLCHAQPKKGIYPDHITTQYAGSTGWLAVGAGYDLFRQHARIGLQYGVVPEEKGGKLHIVSTSFFYKPCVLKVSDRISLNPLDPGLKISYHFGEQFYVNWPSRFPKGYYWWSSALRLHLATESSITYQLKSTRIKYVTTYLQLNSNDLYLVSYILNARSLSLPDIVKAGIGIRFGI